MKKKYKRLVNILVKFADLPAGELSDDRVVQMWVAPADVIEARRALRKLEKKGKKRAQT